MDFPSFDDCMKQNRSWEALLRDLHRKGIINGAIPGETPPQAAGKPADPERHQGGIQWATLPDLLARFFGGESAISAADRRSSETGGQTAFGATEREPDGQGNRVVE